MLKKMLAELIGTFFLLLAIGMTALPGTGNAGNLAPLAIGLALTVMVYSCGHISGAHFNPAVTLGVLLRGKCKISEAPLYVGAQLFGAALAIYSVLLLKGHNTLQQVAEDTIKNLDQVNVGKYLAAEAVGTFALVWVVLNVATAKKTEGNSFYGIAIGMTVAAMAFALGPISGGAFNPAVVFGLALVNKITPGQLWIYLVPQFVAAVVAALLFNMTHDDGASA